MSLAPAPPSAPVEPTRPLIEVRDLVKRYGDKTVLSGVDLEVYRGETLVVIGGSGSGKTTLARLIMGLEKPTSGRIFLKGVEMTALDSQALISLRARFAMVFQKSALLDSMSVLDNVAFPLREQTALDEPTIRERVLLKLRALGIEDAANKLPGQLSGGMAKRAAIARAMITEPEILVYDEPTSGLDPVSSRMVDELIEQMRDRFFVTSIVISHDMVTAFQIADRLALLSRGTIVTSGPPAEVLRSHSAEVERFAASSGIDLDEIARPATRKSPSEIGALWEASRPAGEHEEKSWWRRRQGDCAVLL
ncbi:MAG TPA: ABC transporter ATP-binding protein [Polyangiaceae bacterium]